MERVISQNASSITRQHTKFQNFLFLLISACNTHWMFWEKYHRRKDQQYIDDAAVLPIHHHLPLHQYCLSARQWMKSDQKQRDLCERAWRAWQMCREKAFQRIHNKCTASFALRETYIILVNSTHRLEFWDFSLTLSFNHYQCLQFLVARKLLPILVDDHKIIEKFRLEGTLGGL